MGIPYFSMTSLRSVFGSYHDSLLFSLSLSGQLVALSCDHHGLRGYPDIVFQR